MTTTNGQAIQLPEGPVGVSPEAIEDVDYDPEMTEERADAIVEAVRNSPEYNRARTAAARRRGRPSLSGVDSSERVSARMTKGQRAALQRYAQAHGSSMGAVLREAVDEYLTRHAS